MLVGGNIIRFSKMKWLLVLFLATVICNCQSETFKDRFLTHYNKIKSASSGYFSKNGVPYRCAESLLISSADYGHSIDSEAWSYYIWLEAMYGGVTGDFSTFNNAWQKLEDTLVPKLQPSVARYNHSVPILTNDGLWYGRDPLFEELRSTYGNQELYVLHWLADVDNKMGFGNTNGQCETGPSSTDPSLYQLGYGNLYTQIPSPTCDNWKYGGPYGFQYVNSGANKIWIYGAGPDADARVVQASFWASQWAQSQGKTSQITSALSKASKLGDFLRYSLFDKNFKKIGNCTSKLDCPAGQNKESAHYLISWTISWGGSIDPNGYSWRLGSSEAYYAYQNPIAAYGLASDPNLKPKSPTAAQDWAQAVEKQLDLLEYVQSVDGPFIGAVTNSWNSNFEVPPSNLFGNTFNGMFYMSSYTGASSNAWFGQQTWVVDRLAQYYYVTGNERAKKMLDKWVNWVLPNIKLTGTSYEVPNFFQSSGIPPNVKVTVTSSSHIPGPAAATARILSFYAAKSGNSEAKQVAKELLDRMWNLYQTDKGVSLPLTVTDYTNMNNHLYIPLSGWTGTYPNNIKVDSSSNFLTLRPWLKNEEGWDKVQSYLNGGSAPQFTWHEMWAQCEVGLALGTYSMLFNE